MSKQVYIDSNGNEVQVSGTVNTADMMPMSGNDSTKVKTAIGDLSTLTTTDTSSLVGAVNAVNGKFKTFAFSGTTNSHGNLSLTGVNSTVIAVGANCNLSSVYVTIGKNSTGSRIMLCFRNIDTDEQVINTAVSGTMLYYDI